jgi:anti-anti-sigma factor
MIPTMSRDVTRGPAGLEFDYGMEAREDTLLVYLRGPLVYETLVPLECCWNRIRAEARPSVRLDLSEVTLLGSAALGCLLGLRRWLEARGAHLRVTAASPEVRQVLQVTGLDRFFVIDDETHVSAA